MVRRAVSLFSGCGGFCEGARLAGFSIVAAVEADRHAAETYRFNFPEVALFEGDVRSFATTPDWDGHGHFETLASDRIDLVFGGPPCQGFSQIGPRALDDPRNRLYLEYARVLRVLRPRLFVLENVPNMLLIGGGMFKRRVLTALRRAGYDRVAVRVVAANDYGVPQRRERAIFFGLANDVAADFDLEQHVDSVLAGQERPTVSVGTAIGDLPRDVAQDNSPLGYPLSGGDSPFLDEMRLDKDGKLYAALVKTSRAGGLVLHNHHTKEIQARRLRLISSLGPGMKADDLPEDLWNGSRPEKWRRFDPLKPAHTLTAQMHRDLSEWVHPEHNRWITVREAARLQSFHDGFVFRSSEWQMLKQIGNAVPPLLGHALIHVAARALDRIDEAAAVAS